MPAEPLPPLVPMPPLVPGLLVCVTTTAGGEDPGPPLVLPDGWVTLLPGPPESKARSSSDSRHSRHFVDRDRCGRWEENLNTADRRVENMARFLDERIR
jgi:hypothetical protein